MKTKFSSPGWENFTEFVRDRRYAEARRLLVDLLELYPNSHKLWRWMLKLSQNDDHLLESYRKLLQIAPLETAYRHHFIKFLFERGVAYAKSGNHQTARTFFAEASQLHPKSEKIWYWRAYVSENNLQRAEYLAKVLELNPDHEQARKWLETRKKTAPEPWNCPICQEAHPESQSECSQCRSILDLRRIEEILGPRKVDQNLVHMGITNLQHRALNGHRFQNRYHIGIAYLNLKQWEKAFEVFLEIQPKQSDLPFIDHAIQFLNAKAQADLEARKPPARYRGTVMIVDDSATVRKLVSITVEELGFKALEASNGSQALSQVFEDKPDVIFLDIKMPQMDGYQVCKILKENKHTQNIPVIMLTGQDGIIDRVRGKMAGAMDYITKPFDAETLASALERHFCARIRHGH